MSDGPGEQPEVASEDADASAAGDGTAHVLRIEIRRIERRVPGIGRVSFRAPSALSESALEPYYAQDAADARAFASALIAICVAEPVVTATEVDAWTERARSIARVAAAESIDCLDRYRRLAGTGRSGDERLLEAMQLRNAELRERMRTISGALSSTVTRIFDPSRLMVGNAFETLRRTQRQADLLTRPGHLAEMTRTWNRWSRAAHIEHVARVNRISQQLSNSARLGVRANLPRFGVGGATQGFGVRHTPLFAQLGRVNKLAETLAGRNSVLVSSLGLDANRIAGLTMPRYFGALNASLAADRARLFPRLFDQLLPHYQPDQFHALSRLAESFRDRFTSPLRNYVDWVEAAWAAAKAERRTPILFVVASLPAIIGLRLLDDLDSDDELLLSRLETALSVGTLRDELQMSLQRSAGLDAVAKRHLVQAIEWIATGRYVDAAPPLCDGLERAFRLTARSRGVIDNNNRFLVSGAHRARMHKVEDTFRYLDLDSLYVRYLNAWVFGEVGNLARHGDLQEEEHRRWVLRAVIALVGWIEYIGGEPNAVAELVERLELDQDEAAV